MRFGKHRRWVGWAIVLAAASAGCNSKPKDPGPESSPSAPSAPTPRVRTEAYLTALNEGLVSPTQLTPVFRQAITRPKGDPQADIRDYLSRFKDVKFFVLEESTFGNFIALRGRAESPGRKDAFSVRMLKDEGGYKLDWLQRTERMGMNIPAQANEDLAAAQDAVRNFLDVLLGGDLRLAHALMTPAWKKKLAPPTPADAKAGYDYDPGFLTQATKAWKIGEYLGYDLPRAEVHATQGKATFSAELDGGKSKVTYTVQATRAGAGWWLIEAFGKN